MTNAVAFRRARNKTVEVTYNGRYAACIEKDAFDRTGYVVIVAIDRRSGAAAQISQLTFDRLATAKAYCEVWLATGDPRLAIHKTLMRLPEYAGR